MPNTVNVQYGGPSGCLIVDGVECPKGEIVALSREAAEHVVAHMPDHQFTILGATRKDPAEATVTDVADVAAVSKRAVERAETPPSTPSPAEG